MSLFVIKTKHSLKITYRTSTRATGGETLIYIIEIKETFNGIMMDQKPMCPI
jgi:hypothetical protein